VRRLSWRWLPGVMGRVSRPRTLLPLLPGSTTWAVSSGVSPSLISNARSPLSRQTRTGTPLPGAVAATIFCRSWGVSTRLPSNSINTSPEASPARSAGLRLAAIRAEAPRRPLLRARLPSARVSQPEALRDRRRQLQSVDAQAAGAARAVYGELTMTPVRHVRRHGEADTHVPAGAREDGAVDADDLARHVHEGAAGVSGIDG